MRWIPWIVLGILAAGIGLIFTKNSHRETATTQTATQPVSSGTTVKAAGTVAPAAFAAPADSATSHRGKAGRDTALAAYNQEANSPTETAPADADPAATTAPAAPSEIAPANGEPRAASAAAGTANAGAVPVPNAAPATDAFPPDVAPPAEPTTQQVHPLPEPRTAGAVGEHNASGDNRPLSNLDPPIGAREPAPAAHDSAHQPYYPSAKPAVSGPLPHRNTDAWEAIHRKAAMKAEMRGRRLATQKWFGYSNLRPTASATPFLSTYSPSWTGNSAHPSHWTGTR